MHPLLLLLGLLDGLSALSLIILHFGFEPTYLLVFLSIYLIMKIIIFLGDITSIIDALAGVYILLAVFVFSSIDFFTFAFAIFLAQKSMFSMLTIFTH